METKVEINNLSKSSFWDKFSKIDYCTLEIQLLIGFFNQKMKLDFWECFKLQQNFEQ